MSIDWIAFAALAVVLVLFAGLYLIRNKVDFTISVILALTAGVILGIIFNGHTSWITPIGKAYVSVLSAIVSPLIIVAVISSITTLTNPKQLKGIGLRSIGWLVTTTFFAIMLALGLGLTFGVGRNSFLSIDGVDASTFEGKVHSFSEIFIGFFPRNVISDVVEENTIPMIFTAILVAVAYVILANENEEKVKPFKDFVQAVKEIIFKILDWVVELTPYAVLTLVATSVGNGLSSSGIIYSLLMLLIVSFIAFIIDTWGINYVLLKVFAKVKPGKFFKKILPAQIIAFSTQSSAGTLPVATEILTDKIGVEGQVANVTTPLGTTIGMPGCAGIWPILVAVYGINGLGLNFSATDYILLIIVALFVSFGTAGVPGTATVTTASVLTVMGLPLELIVLTIPISALADTGRTATNITGAMVSATIVARQENALNETIFEQEDEITVGEEVKASVEEAKKIEEEYETV
ncbi:dicarboxylate/amino acid:cation symporter [uncultured Eubacterium sp.]|uniref:dicarboxylate/amino acid:cation symporter n=1 Tax=uncultured Eubacterium sp. TaxID=165185 RepID=UPI0032635EC4